MATKGKNNFTLLSDEPILESERADYLEFEHAAKVLARAAIYTDSPITIGVYGNWGSGKTSLMRMMKQIVEDEGRGDDAAVAVWFNAWQYEREEHLLVPLIAAIARDIKKKQEKWEKEKSDAASKALNIMKTGGKKVHDALRSVLYGVSMKGKLGVPLLGELEISASMKDMIKRYEEVTQDTLMARSLYFDAFDQLQELSHDADIKKPQIVVFIDDLDRCFPEQAVRLLESIKLVLHQPNFAFVLGIYPQIIEEFIRNKYAANYPMVAARAASLDEKEFNNRMEKYLDYFNDYLEKIVQVSHDVPERSPGQMQNYIRYLLEDAGVADQFFLEGVSEKDLLELIAEVGKRSPREIVRKINRLIVKWRITKGEKEEGETFDLLAGLINETVQDRVLKSRHEYEQFLYILEWPVGEEGSPTFGKSLAEGLESTQKIDYHVEKITRLKENLNAEKSATMKSLIEILNKDEHLCNVLNSGPGRRWLSNKKYREEMGETYKEKKYGEETLEPVDKMAEMLVSREVRTKKTDDLGQVIQGLRWIDIPAGEFQMGSQDGRDDEMPVHRVKLDSFKMCATPVTQGQYEALMGVNPSEFKGKERSDLPVENVSWDDAMVFCERMTKLAKGEYRVMLPTEAQWEYAARGGNNSKGYKFSGSSALDDVGWYNENSKSETHPVAAKKPNELVLYDMSGNVWEWCSDWYGEKYYDGCNEQGVVENPGGPETGSYRVLRGGGWNDGARSCRCSYRNYSTPASRGGDVGFRLVFVP